LKTARENPEHANDDDIEALVQKAVGETAAGL
jgi:hypothetical protein